MNEKLEICFYDDDDIEQFKNEIATYGTSDPEFYNDILPLFKKSFKRLQIDFGYINENYENIPYNTFEVTDHTIKNGRLFINTNKTVHVAKAIQNNIQLAEVKFNFCYDEPKDNPNNEFPEIILQILEALTNKSLQCLDFGLAFAMHYVDHNYIDIFGQALAKIHEINILKIYSEYLPFFNITQNIQSLCLHNEDIDQLAAFINFHRRLKSIDFYSEDTFLAKKKWKKLGQAIKNSSLYCLKFVTNTSVFANISDYYHKFLSLIFSHPTIQVLVLEDTNLNKISILSVENKTQIKSLNLCNCNLDDDDLVSWAKFLETNTTLEVLNLRHNEFSDKGAEALITALLNNPVKALRALYLSDHVMLIESYKKIFHFLNNYPLTIFSFSGDSQDTGEGFLKNILIILELAFQLKTNRTLKKLDLSAMRVIYSEKEPSISHLSSWHFMAMKFLAESILSNPYTSLTEILIPKFPNSLLYEELKQIFKNAINLVRRRQILPFKVFSSLINNYYQIGWPVEMITKIIEIGLHSYCEPLIDNCLCKQTTRVLIEQGFFRSEEAWKKWNKNKKRESPSLGEEDPFAKSAESYKVQKVS